MNKEQEIEIIERHIDNNIASGSLVEQALSMSIDALKAQLFQEGTTSDLIYIQQAIDALEEQLDYLQMLNKDENPGAESKWYGVNWARNTIADLPSAQPEPLSDAYAKAVWTWLLEYQIKVAELKGRYTPYEVLSWVANDWRKEHEGSD